MKFMYLAEIQGLLFSSDLDTVTILYQHDSQDVIYFH